MQSGIQVNHKRERNDRKHQSAYTEIGDITVVREFYFSEEIETKQGEKNNPDGQVNFPVEDVESINLVDVAEEFQSEGKQNKGEYHLNGV